MEIMESREELESARGREEVDLVREKNDGE